MKHIPCLSRRDFTNKGETLIEAIGALAIIAIVVTAASVAIITALSNANFNQNQTQSTKFAQQGLEVVRQIRDADYTGFRTYAGTYCLAEGQTVLNTPVASCPNPNVSEFIRTVTVTQDGCSVNVAEVSVKVAFTDGKCQLGEYCHDQTHTSCLTTVNPIIAP